ncbi:MAG: putative bifunctional diguanylate cyclase/phosphodiesterase, partial [Dehalococcoidia bacterium]
SSATLYGEASALIQGQLQTALTHEREKGDEVHLANVETVQAGVNRLTETAESVVLLRQAGDVEGAVAGLRTLAAETIALQPAISVTIQAERQEMVALRSHANRTAEFAFWLLVASSAGGLTLGIALSLLVASSIIKPLSSLEATAVAVSTGDLTARARATGPRELARLGKALNRMMATVEERTETIRHLAYHDALTGLPNRALFQDRFTVAVAQARRNKEGLAVMSLDLDRFKLVNDTLGHGVGDRLLQNVAQRLGGLVREGDTIARLGGDEFLLLLPGIVRAEDAAKMGGKILEAISVPFHLDGTELHTTTSIGISLFPDDGKDLEALLMNADAAMYRAKEQGRNRYQLYTPAVGVEVYERLALENALRQALVRQELVVHYQPVANVNTGEIIATEALVRWQHPERGLLFPAEFIPLAEETGLIVPLGEWVLHIACAQNKAWQDAGLSPLRVAVNLSARQFQQPDLVEMVARVLKETHLDPHLLELEITEGTAMQNLASTIAVLHDLREMGVRIAIDDFGAGYSSLSYLKNLPVDALKIDRSFVCDLTTDPSDAAIAAAVIAMAHTLDLKVVAEGVENEDQLAFLRRRQCDRFQGYLLAKPMPAKALQPMLAQDKLPAGRGTSRRTV